MLTEDPITEGVADVAGKVVGVNDAAVVDKADIDGAGVGNGIDAVVIEAILVAGGVKTVLGIEVEEQLPNIKMMGITTLIAVQNRKYFFKLTFIQLVSLTHDFSY